MNKKAIIFLNGDIPFKILKNFDLKGTYKICADGAANELLKYRVIPDIILGDMDSIEKKSIIYYKKKNVEIRKIDEQETTDFEKALIYALENEFNEINIFGASSKRQDHTINNYSVLKRYSKTFDLKIFNNKSVIYFINNNIKINYRKNEIVSLMPMPYANGIYTKGLEYKLENESLEFGIREGTLNKSISDKIEIKFEEGCLLLILKHFLK